MSRSLFYGSRYCHFWVYISQFYIYISQFWPFFSEFWVNISKSYLLLFVPWNKNENSNCSFFSHNSVFSSCNFEWTSHNSDSFPQNWEYEFFLWLLFTFTVMCLDVLLCLVFSFYNYSNSNYSQWWVIRFLVMYFLLILKQHKYYNKIYILTYRIYI